MEVISPEHYINQTKIPRNTVNRRKNTREITRPQTRTKNQPHSQREAVAIILLCIAVLTGLSLYSYSSDDVSLNASAATDVKNWIGPAGSYWSDLLLQTFGFGSYFLPPGLVFVSWRALIDRKIFPSVRELFGTLCLMFSCGAGAHIIGSNVLRPFPAGGVVGAVIANTLSDHFAVLGAFVITSSIALVSTTFVANGAIMRLAFLLARLGVRLGVLTKAWLKVFVSDLKKLHKEQKRQNSLKNKKIAGDARLADDKGFAADNSACVNTAEGYNGPADSSEDEDHSAFLQLHKPAAKHFKKLSNPNLRMDHTLDLQAEDDFSLSEEGSVDKAANSDVAEQLNGVDDDREIAIHAAIPPATMVAGQRVAFPQDGIKGEPQIVDVRPVVDAQAIEKAALQKVEQLPRNFELPSPTLLEFVESERPPIDTEKLRENALRLTKTLKDYGITGQVREIRPGPVVTMYEYVPAAGIKVSKIASLADDLAMSMEALRVRIVAPIPGKGAVGIEIPNETRETVYVKELITHEQFRKTKSRLTIALGKDIEGNPMLVDMAKMPHLLVAGATGAGKSVSVNTMIMSVLFKATPEEVRMLMVDPKMLELSIYDGIPHLLLPVVTDPKKAATALRWAVEEMERRYEILSHLGVRNIASFNQKIEQAKGQGKKITIPPKRDGEEARVCESMPYIMIIVDELADLMMVASRDVETSIMRLAQMARAAGIHLLLATQRPSVDVLTGVIKANFPTRIAFQVASKHDSRTIIDGNGAEHLLGKGDMLYMSPGLGGLTRIHGAFVSDEEIQRTVEFLKKQADPQYDESILQVREDSETTTMSPDSDDHDDLYDQAIAIVQETRQASISLIQRRLRIGYNRAARMVERMETEGLVGPSDNGKPRPVLIGQAMMG